MWPSIIRQVQASCPNRSVFSPKTPHPSADFLLISFLHDYLRHRRVRSDIDPCYDAHPYLKGSAGDLWVALSGTLGLSCTHRMLYKTFDGYFLKLQQNEILHNELKGFNQGGTQTTRAAAFQKVR